MFVNTRGKVVTLFLIMHLQAYIKPYILGIKKVITLL